jgi:hypothetical protein
MTQLLVAFGDLLRMTQLVVDCGEIARGDGGKMQVLRLVA